MIGKILLLTSLALSQGSVIEPERTLIASELCPAQGHYLLPHEYDCTKFYYCEYGKKWENSRDCSPGTEFSYALQVCVHPELANCNLPGTPPPDSEESTEVPTQTPVPIITTEPPTEAPTQTPVPIITTEAPTEAPTQTPVPIITTEAPTEAPTQTPVPIITTEAPTEAPTQTPVPIITTEAPTESPTQTPIPIITTEAPTEPPTQTPVPITTTEATETPEPITLPTEKPEPEILPNGCPADFNEHLLLPHETECNKFYYCVFGDKVERQCAPGTYFNPAIQVCDWPENVDCVNGDSSQEDLEGSGDPDIDVDSSELLPNGCPADFDVHKLLPHESDCRKFYYCVQGETVERECGDGTLFNVELQVCDWPQNVDCNRGSSSEDNSSENNSGDNNSEDDSDNNNSNDNDSDEVLDNGCPADFDVHKLLPHENDCGKFYYCVNGKKVERECGPGTHFNPVLQVCDWPESAGCTNGASSEGNSEENSGESEEIAVSGEGSGDGEIDINPDSELPNGCPADFDVHQLLPHESDCAKFYYCVYGEKVERDCGPGTHFNPTLQVCDWPQNAGCAIGGSSEDSNNNSGENNGNSGENNGNSNESNGNSGENNGNSGENNGNSGESNEVEVELLPNGCPADFDIHQLLPHESDCGKFYYCVQGEKVERECRDGLFFNPAIQVCDWPANVDCTNSNSAESGNSEENNNSAENGSGDNGSGDSGSGDNGSGDSGSGDNGSGDNGSGDNGVLPNGCPADFDVHQLLPHESDYAKFYYCVHGEKVERDCGPGTHFNPVEQICDWPQNAGCANAGSNENSEENGSGDNNSEENGSGDSGNGDSGNGDNGNGVLDNGCPADFNVHQLLPHESDCAKFYYCVHGEKVERDCGPGTHFNPTLQVCDWPHNAGCANSGSGESSSENNGNSSENNGNSSENNGNSSENNGNSSENAGSNEVELLPNGCPVDFDIHELLPHETECGKFYYCVHGEKVERECSDGLHFNPAIQVCDWPSNVDCSNANSAENGSAENGSSENGSSENGSSENGNEIASDKCKSSCNIASWAHEHDCDKFWRCDGEIAVLGVCSEGLHFNVNSQTCDFICNAGCVRDDVQSTPEHDGLKLFLPWNKVDNTIRKLYLTGQK